MNELIKTEMIFSNSLDVAKWTDKQHSHVLNDIRIELKQLENVGISGESLFRLSSYTNGLNHDSILLENIICIR